MSYRSQILVDYIEKQRQHYITGEGFKSEEHEGDDHLVDIMADDSYVWTISMIDRPMTHAFLMDVEYKYFPPISGNNEKHIYIVYHWHDITWIIMGVPAETKDTLDRIAESYGLRLRWGYLPLLFTGDGQHMFPCRDGTDTEHIATIENNPSSELYKGGEQLLRKFELETCEKIWNDFQSAKA